MVASRFPRTLLARIGAPSAVTEPTNHAPWRLGATCLLAALASALLLAGCAASPSPAGWELRGKVGRGEVCSLAFADSLHGWAVNFSVAGVWSSSDGGRNWKRCRGRIVDAPTSGAGALPRDIARLPEPAEVVAFGQTVIVSYYGRKPGVGELPPAEVRSGILISKDGGASWRSCLMLPDAEESVISLAASDAEHLWVLCCKGVPDDERSPSWLLASSDGGASWQRLPQPARIAGLYAQLTGLARFFDPQHGWAFGLSRDGFVNNLWIMATADGGRSWRAGGETLGGPPFWALDPQRAWSVGGTSTEWGEFGGCYFSTHDGGQTWRRNRRFDDTDLRGVIFTDRQHGWVMGHSSIHEDFEDIYATSDGGQHWSREAAPTKDFGGLGGWRYCQLEDGIIACDGIHIYWRPLP